MKKKFVFSLAFLLLANSFCYSNIFDQDTIDFGLVPNYQNQTATVLLNNHYEKPIHILHYETFLQGFDDTLNIFPDVFASTTVYPIINPLESKYLNLKIRHYNYFDGLSDYEGSIFAIAYFKYIIEGSNQILTDSVVLKFQPNPVVGPFHISKSNGINYFSSSIGLYQINAGFEIANLSKSTYKVDSVITKSLLDTSIEPSLHSYTNGGTVGFIDPNKTSFNIVSQNYSKNSDYHNDIYIRIHLSDSMTEEQIIIKDTLMQINYKSDSLDFYFRYLTPKNSYFDKDTVKVYGYSSDTKNINLASIKFVGNWYEDNYISLFNAATLPKKLTANIGGKSSNPLNLPLLCIKREEMKTFEGAFELLFNDDGNLKFRYIYFRAKPIANTTVLDKGNSEIIISPNPADNFLNINEMYLGWNCKIIDLVGRIHYNSVLADTRISINGLDDGLYVLILNKEKLMKSEKLIILKNIR